MNSRDAPVWVRWASVPAIVLLLMPVIGLLARAMSPESLAAIAAPQATEAIAVSVMIATGATVACVLFGLPLAWWLASTHGLLARALRTLGLAPLVMPPVVAGTGLLLVFGRSSALGRTLDAAGLTVPFTSLAAVLAGAFVAMPLFVLTMEAAFRRLEPTLDELAESLGADPWTRLRWFIWPQLRGAFGAATLLCLGRALGEFGATITFAGSFPGRTRTVPLAVYHLLQRDEQAAVALSLALIAASILIMLVGARGIESR